MFKDTLEAQLKSIFGVKKVSFAMPSESLEQEVLFVSIASARYRPQETKISGMLTGKITLYANSDKLPFGYFIKKIHLSTVDDKDLFFYNIEENSNYMGAVNLVERSCEFRYFYSEDFNPDRGEITETNFI